jgi:hypothetical protein
LTVPIYTERRDMVMVIKLEVKCDSRRMKAQQMIELGPRKTEILSGQLPQGEMVLLLVATD